MVKMARTTLSWILVSGLILLSGCCKLQDTPEETSYRSLKAYIDSIKVINTHEHQHLAEFTAKARVNFFSILASSYLQADLSAAGAPAFDNKLIDAGNLDTLWERYGAYLDYSRNTSYYGQLVQGFRILYGFREPYFTRENVLELSQKIEKNYREFDIWYPEAFKKANFSLMLNDQYWDQLRAGVARGEYALVMRIDKFLNTVANRSEKEKSPEDSLNNPFYMAKKEGFTIRTLDDYLKYAEMSIKKFAEARAVCAKTANAYDRTIYYEDVPQKEVEALFLKPSESLTAVEKKRLEDFMFHWCVKKCAEYDLPLQIHTGYLAGSRAVIDNGMPMKLLDIFIKYPDEKFILFHGGYPWYQEIGALAKSFPNVYIDIVWLPQISREGAVSALHQWLDCVPYDKFFWGGDCSTIEEATGSLEYGRDVVARVLAQRVTSGTMRMDLAREVARNIFRDNALKVFRLEEKLGRKLED